MSEKAVTGSVRFNELLLLLYLNEPSRATLGDLFRLLRVAKKCASLLSRCKLDTVTPYCSKR